MEPDSLLCLDCFLVLDEHDKQAYLTPLYILIADAEGSASLNTQSNCHFDTDKNTFISEKSHYAISGNIIGIFITCEKCKGLKIIGLIK